jgi:hypothetical protein
LLRTTTRRAQEEAVDAVSGKEYIHAAVILPRSKGFAMSQRSFFLMAVLLLLFISGVAATLMVLVRQEPAWYTTAAIPSGPQRAADSKAFVTEFFAMINSTKYEEEPQIALTDVQTNSFFEEDFLAMHYDRQLSLDHISQPRVAFTQDHIKVGFRYGHGLGSSIVSIDLRVWVPASEPNVVALELEGFHAGTLPISAQSLLEEIADISRKNGIDVNWYRFHNHPVALIRFQPDQARPTFRLKAVQLKEHSIMIQWHMLDFTPTKPSEPAPKPVAAP